MNTDPELSSWTVQELSLINTVELFRLKPKILKKVEARFEQLRAPISSYCQKSLIEFPEGTDSIKGQIARGENNKGFPYISYDLPQKFSKTEFYTFRSLFWWGHYLGFSLILKGGKLKQYTHRLLGTKSEEKWNSVYYSTSPWEWDESSFKSVVTTDPQLISSQVEEADCLKLICIYPVNAEGFTHLNWEPIGLQAFKTFSSITQ